MNIPMQSTPIHRLANSAARRSQSGGISPSESIATTGQPGVQPDGIFDDIVRTVAPIAIQALPGLLGSI
jgi:hypothetical protein